MASVIFRLVFDEEDAKLDRQEFRKLGRSVQHYLTGLKYNWSYTLANTFGEVIKNFHDHGRGQGTIEITIKGNEAWWEARNADGGDEAGRTMDEIIAYVNEHGTSRPDTKHMPNGNAGAGLVMMRGGFDGLTHCDDVIQSTWHLDSKDCFAYGGHIIFKLRKE
jgi:hypothetical protein